jgi:hypothetical protein
MDNKVEKLISLKTEGGYWDFKEKWHSNNSDLLHDIICMANNIEDKDAYILIGVTDNGKICGVSEENRKNQCDLIDFLRQIKFAGEKRPIVTVKILTVCEKEIDVIVIKNTTDTPYYLTDDYQGVYKGHIYTRIGDTNTPKNKTADVDKTEFLWKKRFGLNLPVFSLAKKLLNESENWISRYDEMLEMTTFHHKVRPEFTVDIINISFSASRIDKPNFWYFYLYNVHGVVLHPMIWFKHLSIKYHTTILYETEVISCDEGNYLTVPLQNETFYASKYDGGYNQGLIVAYLILDSDDAYIQNFLNIQYNSAENKSILAKREIDEVVLYFNNEEEKAEFFNMLKSNSTEFLKAFKPNTPPIAIPTDNRDGYDIAMSLRGSKILAEWLKVWRTNSEIVYCSI